MKVKVNKTTCNGCGLCSAVCPAVFRSAGSVAEVVPDAPVAEELTAVRDAIAVCPSGSIELESDESAD